MDYMTYVHDYIWYVLGGAGVLGFLFAWIIRGSTQAGLRRRATVERDIAQTELEQVRSELDSLYAAQRKQKEGGVTPSTAPSGFEAEIRERDEQIQRMAEELTAAKASLQSLKEGQSAEDAPAGDAGEAFTELQSRNSFLEDRVSELEAKIAKTADTTSASAAEAAAEEGEDEDKLVWQVDYLKSRVAALEEQLVNGETSDGGVTEASAADEELARLRWRNRYLEGRLAYYEEGAETEADEADEPDEATVLEADEAEEDTEADQEDDVHPSERMLEALGMNDSDEDEEAEISDEDEAEEIEAGAEAEDDETGAEEVSVAPGVQPVALDKPNGEADDLTLITGIGPRIQTILNDYGIWHFSQIADWSPENEAWIDQELNFAGRVSREGWIGQARELAGVSSET